MKLGEFIDIKSSMQIIYILFKLYISLGFYFFKTVIQNLYRTFKE